MKLEPTATTSTIHLHEPEGITEAIVNAVADAEDVSPLELQPLATVIDPDALDKAIRSGNAVSVEFTYCGYLVGVSSDGYVTLSE